MEGITAHERLDIIEARMGWPSTGLKKKLPDPVLDEIGKIMRELPIGKVVADGYIRSSLTEFHDRVLLGLEKVARVAMAQK